MTAATARTDSSRRGDRGPMTAATSHADSSRRGDSGSMTAATSHVDSSRRGDRGSMAIELVGMVPLLVLVTILCVQGFLAAATAGAAQKAARDGARADVMGNSGPAAARDSLPGWVGDSRVYQGSAAKGSCGGVCYRVEVEVPLVVPGFSTSLVTISRSAEMRG